ncbi:MAG: aspartate carbamoyltransferase [Oscillospiraceae bacterium]
MEHFIDIKNHSKDEILQVIALAEDIIQNPGAWRGECSGKILATLFFEPSTRTRLSFEAAMLSLGGDVLGFSEANASSAAKGESVADTVRTVACYADLIAMRHPKEGAALLAAGVSEVPVINAGDGGHAHPTQTLTDLLTIKRETGRLDDLTVGLCGDLKFGRTVHSLIEALSAHSGIRIVAISPDELRVPEYLKSGVIARHGMPFTETDQMEGALGEVDILYMTRVQRERFFNEEDYLRLKDQFILDTGKMRLMRDDAVVLHPLPRVNEISVKVDADPRAAYFRQVKNGKFVRMALITLLLKGAALQ